MTAVQPKPLPNLTIKHKQLFINNEFVDAVSGKKFDVLNPSNGEVICQVAEAEAVDVNKAVDAAVAAFDRRAPWRTMDAGVRGLLMYKLADLIEQHQTELATIESMDNGKPFQIAYAADIALCIKCIRYYAGWADKNHGKVIPVDGPYFNYTLHEPVGVCAQIIPWNFPLLMACWKLGPALSMGNTVVLKTAEQTPLTALFLANLIREVGFPPGVVNILTGFGPECGAPLAKHPKCDKVAFTGSTEVGQLIQQYAAGNLKRVTLECGGKSPVVVLKDADLDYAVDICHLGLFFNQGQCCIAGSRVFVEAPIYDQFVEKAKLKAQKMRLGDPMDNSTDQGPQVDADQLHKILGLIESGKEEGATLQTGGNQFGDKGYFVEPTVFSDVKDNMRIAREEIFGPVLAIFKFDTLDEVIDRANDTVYGLGAGIVTNDNKRAMKLVRAIRAGTVYVNCFNVFDIRSPFGGFKMSGNGRELGEYALENYTEVKAVYNAME